MIENGDLLRLSEEVIKPFYQRKSQHAIELLQTAIEDERFRIHKPEGAMFLWLWFKELPISSNELYKRLKEKGLLVVSGHYFFPGLDQGWQHTQECIRLNYAQDEDVVERGVTILADTINALYSEVE